MDGGIRTARLAAARATLAHIDPAPGIEAMLACQMVAAHEAAMACLSRSMGPAAAPGLVDQNLRHAERLTALYARQTEALGRYRAREQKRVYDRRDREQQARQPEITEIEEVYINVDGTEATPEELAEDRARWIADGSLMITPPLDRGAATGDGANGDGGAMRHYLDHDGRP